MRYLIVILVLTGFTAAGQTNKIVFEKLLSASNTVLMVNAEYRCTAGMKVFFLNEDGYKKFEVSALSSNVLAAIGISVEQLEIAKDKQEARHKQYVAQVAVFQQAVWRQEQTNQANIIAWQTWQRMAASQPPIDSYPQHRTVTVELKPRGWDHMGLVP